MIEKVKHFYSLKTTKILTVILLSFFSYIVLNIVCSLTTSLIVYGEITHKPYIYGQTFACKRSIFKTNTVFINITILRFSVFIFVKILFIYTISKMKNFFVFTNEYIKSILYTIMMIDFVYVVFHLLFSSEINWEFYFYSSFFIQGGVSLFFPSWIFFALSGILNIVAFRKNISDFVTLTEYYLFAFLSFFVQLGITYIVFGKIFYKN